MAGNVVLITGPALHMPEAQAIIRDYEREAKELIAREGVYRLSSYGDQFFKNPTGQWESQLRQDLVSSDRVISDQVVYNSWLEGVSSRNQVSRFKGYRLWRLTTQSLNRDKVEIARTAIWRMIRRLNGV